jgi:DNA replication and repair protein RecF
LFLKKLSVRNYRNHSETDIQFSPEINVLYGNNGEGKTNILEAIYYLATGRSHLGSRDSELIRWGASSFSVYGEVDKGNRRTEFDAFYSETAQKRIRVNKKEIHKLSELIGQFCTVMFSPETLKIVQGTPQDRRKYIDFAASQASKQYLHHLQMYYKILSQRNGLLKTGAGQKDYQDNMQVWDQQLIETGSEVIRRRVEFIEELKSVVIPIHFEISKMMENAELQYQSSLGAIDSRTAGDISEMFANELKKHKRLESIRGFTMVGPHRDDIKVYSNGYDLQKFGSQGQQRTAALSLKLGEVELLHRETGEKPIVLLDDVMSELDDERRKLLLAMISGTYQTIITSTNLNPFNGLIHQNMSVYKVFNGSVERGVINAIDIEGCPGC